MAAYPVTATSPQRLASGKLPQYSSVGSYTILYLTAKDAPLCAKCVSKRDKRSIEPLFYGDFSEGAPIECSDCGKPIESSYGDPDEDKESEV